MVSCIRRPPPFTDNTMSCRGIRDLRVAVACNLKTLRFGLLHIAENFAIDLLATGLAGPCLPGDNARTMALSARNQFPGTVISVKTGSVMSEVVIDIGGGHQIVSLISASAARRLKLKKGKKAVAVIKSTEVIVSTDLPDEG